MIPSLQSDSFEAQPSNRALSRHCGFDEQILGSNFSNAAPIRGAKVAKQAALRPQSNALRRDGNSITSRGSLDDDIIISNAPDPV